MSTQRKSPETHPPCKPCFPYPGGKTRLLSRILSLLPAHATYVEPFAGGLAVLLAKPRVPCEVVNDLNSEIANFYRYVRFHCEALLAEIELHLCSRENFQLMLANPGYTDLQRAARWFLLKVDSFGGMSESFGRGSKGFHGFDRQRHSDRIREVSQRLNRVVIENKDWQEVVEFYDRPEALFFFDPPYVSSGKSAYEPFSEFEMERLRRKLDKVKGAWVLTCDDSPACRRIFDRYETLSCSIKYSVSNGRDAKAGRKTSGELIVLSPAIAAQRAA